MKTDPNDGATVLTKREYFAAMAMQGLLSNSDYNNIHKSVVSAAVSWADDLIEELNRTSKE